MPQNAAIKQVLKNHEHYHTLASNQRERHLANHDRGGKEQFTTSQA